MFFKGTMKDIGIDITIKNNPDHVLAPDSWDMVRKVKLGQIDPKEYIVWYNNLFKERWETRNKEIRDLIELGKKKDIKLKCYCSNKTNYCHANLAAKNLNKLIEYFEKNKR